MRLDLIDLYESLLDGKLTKARLVKNRSPDRPMTDAEKWLNLQHHTKIRILNDQGDADVCVQFEAANLSLVPRIERSHFFWWEHPQDKLQFACSSSDERSLPVQTIQSSPHFNEIKVIFPKPIPPFENYRYEISYRVSKALKFCSY